MSPRSTTEDVVCEENSNSTQESSLSSQFPLPFSRWISVPVFLDDDSEVYQATVVYHRVLFSNTALSHKATI